MARVLVATTTILSGLVPSDQANAGRWLLRELHYLFDLQCGCGNMAVGRQDGESPQVRRHQQRGRIFGDGGWNDPRQASGGRMSTELDSDCQCGQTDSLLPGMSRRMDVTYI